MRKKISILLLTDHFNHKHTNSIYPLAKELRSREVIDRLDVCSRGITENFNFFSTGSGQITVTAVTNDFNYSKEGSSYLSDWKSSDLSKYDIVLLRLPPPADDHFLKALVKNFNEQKIFNQPSGIIKTSDKSYLLNFSEFCAPIKKCTTLSEILEFRNNFPIVLKPLKNYGGKGLVRIEGNDVWFENIKSDISEFIKNYSSNPVQYLGMKFLINVSLGDKRILVVNGKVVSASLRFPAENSWLCNISQGGNAKKANLTSEEEKMIEIINPIIKKEGIIMYGIDTLADDTGKRVLSELNTVSAGGLSEDNDENKNAVNTAVNELIHYIQNEVL